jgi:hypothetical protein
MSYTVHSIETKGWSAVKIGSGTVLLTIEEGKCETGDRKEMVLNSTPLPKEIRPMKKKYLNWVDSSDPKNLKVISGSIDSDGYVKVDSGGGSWSKSVLTYSI